jgi:hypothetical protein
VWRVKQKDDESVPLPNINMGFFLPAEYQNQSEEGAAAQLVLPPQLAGL